MPEYLRKPEAVSYMYMEDFKYFSHLMRPRTLRYSYYRAFDHHYTSDTQIDLTLKQLQLHEIDFLMRSKADEVKLLQEYQVPLQARLDLIIDNDENFDYPTVS
jgi:hypothetical protein